MLSYDHAKLQFHRSITCSFGVRAFIVSEDESESPHSFLSEREGRLIPSRQWSAPRVDSLIRNSHLHVQSIGTHQGKRFDKTNMTHKNPNVSLRVLNEPDFFKTSRFYIPRFIARSADRTAAQSHHTLRGDVMKSIPKVSPRGNTFLSQGSRSGFDAERRYFSLVFRHETASFITPN